MGRTSRFTAIGITALLGLAGLFPGPAVQAQAPSITVSNAWARRAPAMGGLDHAGMEKMEKSGKMEKMGTMEKMGQGMGGHGTGAVYVTLSNSGSQPDALVSASTDAAETSELHQTTNQGGVMMMRPVKSIAVPAHGKTELKPGGYHVMLMGLKHDLKPGDKVEVTLQFEHGGPVRVEAPVK
jgi:copper(I)-binding protein